MMPIPSAPPSAWYLITLIMPDIETVVWCQFKWLVGVNAMNGFHRRLSRIRESLNPTDFHTVNGKVDLRP